MRNGDRVNAAAQWMWDARRRRELFRNLPADLRPRAIAQAYKAQAVYSQLAQPLYGTVGGVKVATTTKVMQQLMGISHPCSGVIFAHTIHKSPARVRSTDFVNLRIECEIALTLGADLRVPAAPWTRVTVAPAVAGAMPAFELIEDRHATYADADVFSMIVENCWNGGVVTGASKPIPLPSLVGIAGRLTIDGKIAGEGVAEDPLATLAWLANHLAERGHDLNAGMVIITGSLIPTLSISCGQRGVFTVDRLGEAAIEIV